MLLALATIIPAECDLPFYPHGIRYVDAAGHRIAYYDSATEKPPLLLVHGLGSNLSFWRPNLADLEEAHRVIALDLPGYGCSSKDDVPGTMTFFAETIDAFLETLAVPQVRYVGISMGAQIGMHFALRFAERLERLVLVSPAGIERFSAEEATMLLAAVTPVTIMNDTPENYERSARMNFRRYDEERDGWLMAQRQAMKSRPDFEGYAHANARSVAGMLNEPVFDLLSQIATPSMVIFGTGDMMIPNRFFRPALTPMDLAELAGRKLPGARIELIEGGHLLNLEQPQAFALALADFLSGNQ
jgi:pimeloyl-ACP methyl ester carboxylesterase